MFQNKGIEYVEKAVHMFQYSDVIDRKINGEEAERLEIKPDVSDDIEYPIGSRKNARHDGLKVAVKMKIIVFAANNFLKIRLQQIW